MSLTKRQRELLIACIEAELDNNSQCDTMLSLSEMEDKGDADLALENLRAELVELKTVIKDL